MYRLTSLLSTIAIILSTAVQATPLTDYIPKWSQEPDMDLGTDFTSMHRSTGPVVVDDFMSDGRPITGFHWWGSYLTDQSGRVWDTGQSQVGHRYVQFEISFHLDCPALDPNCIDPSTGQPYRYSTPRNGTYYSAIFDVEEDYYGTTVGGEDVYEYWLSLVGVPGPSFLNETWNEIAGEIYWVDFAWNSGQFGTPSDANVWGWHESYEHYLDNAVTTRSSSVGNPHIGPWNILQGKDMAFEVLTIPEPATIGLLIFGLIGLGLRHKKGA